MCMAVVRNGFDAFLLIQPLCQLANFELHVVSMSVTDEYFHVSTLFAHAT